MTRSGIIKSFTPYQIKETFIFCFQSGNMSPTKMPTLRRGMNQQQQQQQQKGIIIRKLFTKFQKTSKHHHRIRYEK